MELDDLTTGEKVGIGGGVLAVIGAFLPWATVNVANISRSASGLDGDGVITLVLGVAAGGLILMRDWEQMTQVGVSILGLLTLAIGGMAYSDVDSLAAGFGSGTGGISISPGVGLYLTLLAGVLILAGGALGYSTDQQSGQTAGQPGN